MADPLNEYWYLEPGTDASKITMPHLRRILLTHNVKWPSAAKKQDLVDLFNEHVAPQAAQIQRAQAQTKRSTRGIVDVPSSSASTVTTDDMEDDTLLPPEPASTRRTSRRTTRAQTEESELPAPTPRGKTPSRAVPAKHSRAEPEPEADERPAPRRTRKSETPAVKREQSEPEAWHRDDVGSPFTQDNPFQSGSSPAVPDTTSRDRRRRTMGFEQKEKRKSDTHRRRTVQPNVEQLDNVSVPSRGTFDPRFKHDNDDIDDAGEEFTPEEQLELVRERAKAGEVDILPPRRRKKASKATGTLKAMSGTLLLLAATVFGGVWREEKKALGFCGIGRDISTGLAGYDVPDWAAEYIVPTCEPCPPHAQCFRDLELKCEPDFIRKDHPLALYGLIPIPPTCEPDSAKAKKINAVADRAVHILRQRKAQYECGEPDAEGHVVDSPEVSEDELKQQMAAHKIKGMTDQEFSELFDRAFPEMTNREEVIETTDGTSGKRRLATSSLAELSIACSARRAIRQSLERHLLEIVMILFVAATGSYGKYSYSNNKAMEARAKQLASDVFERLANQAALSYQEPGAQLDKGISMAQLRDDVLRDEFSSSRRQKLLDRVQKKVEFNSNIRAAVKTTNTGDVARVWEWVGPLKLLEDGRTSGKRESGRFSFGVGSSPAPETRETQRWDEGRPIY